MSLLDIVSTEDEQFKQYYPKIMKKIEKKKLLEMEPTIDEITKVNEIIIDYIKKNKKKVYGGIALNKLLISKIPSLSIYDETDTPDIEFYTPNPLDDLVKICDELHNKGFKNVVGQEAQHKETYSIFVNFQLYCDITYMPSNIYNKIRYVQMDGLNLIHPWFMTIDFFRMFTNPLVSFWRLEKHFMRYLKLQKTYPLPLINKPLIIESYGTNEFNKIINLLENFLAQKSSIIFTGFYIYNYYLTNSEYFKYDGRFKQIKMPYLEVYSTNYVQDGLDILSYIQELPEEIKKNITHVEFYPFFQFYGYNTVFYYKDINTNTNIPILYLYSNNNKCIPYKEVPYLQFNKNKKEPNEKDFNKKSNTINIGSFDFNILHALIILVKVRIDGDDDWNDILYTFINCLVSFRKHYFTKTKQTLYDDTIYEGFVINCKGETISPEREKRLLIQQRKKSGKHGIYRYEAGISKHPTQYYFANSSGNAIKNKINFKLTLENLNKKIEDQLSNELENELENELTNESEQLPNEPENKFEQISNESEK